jgi:SAM-dependent methyltransferase
VSTYLCEADVSEGLEALARDELSARLGATVRLAPASAALRGVIPFTYSGDLHALLALQTVQAVYLLQRFAVPRPRALLGDEHFRKVLALVQAASGLFPAGAFKTLALNAAGSDSAVMQRLKGELARRAGLALAEDEGDLLLRVRPTQPPPDNGGWDVLVRLSPRPLATRAWRVCNFEGALNAPVAHALVRLLQPRPHDCYVNMACGSGTLLVERLAAGRVRQAIGVDLDPQALACARANVAASGYNSAIRLLQTDARALPLPSASVDALSADLPFGHLVGSHAQNVRDYPLLLGEAARVLRPAARAGLLTHEARLMEQLLAGLMDVWQVEQVLRVELGGLYPRIFVLRRSG